MERRFEQAIASFRAAMRRDGPNGALASALAQAYEQVAFQTLADQVRRSVRSCRGNRWMFRVGAGRRASDPDPSPAPRARVGRRRSSRSWSSGRRSGSTSRTAAGPTSSSSGMDYPEGARVLNISVDLGVHGRDDQPRPADRDAACGSSPSRSCG